jgi:hypothetical protein
MVDWDGFMGVKLLEEWRGSALVVRVVGLRAAAGIIFRFWVG